MPKQFYPGCQQKNDSIIYGSFQLIQSALQQGVDKGSRISPVAWSFGIGELHADIEWDADTIKHVDNGLESHFKIDLVPGKGHSMYSLIAQSQAALVFE